MKKRLLFILPMLIIPLMIFAQDKAEVSIKITKDGKVVKDTTYQYDDLEKAKHALKLMDIMSSEDMDHEHMKVMHMKDMHTHQGEHAKKGEYKYKMMISEDGEHHEIKGDKMTWVSADTDGETVLINEEDGTMEIIIKEMSGGENDGKVKIRKEVIVIADDELQGDGDWTVKEGKDGETIYLSEDGKKVKIIKKELSGNDEDNIWTSKEADSDEDVEVIVIKKKMTGDDEKMEVEVSIDDSKKDVEKKMGKKKKNK